MKFAIQVNASPYQAQAGESAYQFIKAALAMGHAIVRVFFYYDGVYHGFGGCRPPQDEPQPLQRWAELADDHGVDLVLCISAAQRRGLLTTTEAGAAGIAPGPVAPGFRIAGLGLWVEACLQADRVLVFRA
jgi:tRNA 2-thiouridine synthesizing protein D